MTSQPPTDPTRTTLLAALMDAHNPDKPHRRRINPTCAELGHAGIGGFCGWCGVDVIEEANHA